MFFCPWLNIKICLLGFECVTYLFEPLKSQVHNIFLFNVNFNNENDNMCKN
jgi:hypothetical protein